MIKNQKKEIKKTPNKNSFLKRFNKVYTKNDDEQILIKRRRFLIAAYCLSWLIIPIIWLNAKYGKAAGKFIQEEVEKSKKTKKNSFENFDQIQKVWKRTFPDYKPIALDKVKTGFKKNILTTDDKKDLNILVYSKVNDKGKWVIILHGWTESKYQVTHLIDLYLKLGLNVLVYDQRGHGENDQANTTLGFLEKNDLDLVIEYLEENYDVNQLVLHGQSMGAITILAYLTLYLSKIKNKLIKAAILNGPTGDMKKQMKTFFSEYFQMAPCFFYYGLKRYLKKTAHYSPNRICPRKYIIRTWRWPFLLIHSCDDQMIDPNNSVDIFNLKKLTEKNTRSELYMPEGPGHVLEYPNNPQEFTKKISDFLKKEKII